MSAFRDLLTDNLGLALILLTISALILQRYLKEQRGSHDKAASREFITWRLIITTDIDLNSYPSIINILKEALQRHFQISLADSTLVLASHFDQYCATLTFLNPGKKFTARESFNLDLACTTKHDKSSLRVTRDDNFDGITTLYDGTSSAEDDNAVDLIAVSGLGGHAFKSFISIENTRENWLRDYLPQKLHNIRVLVYGYDTRIATASKKSIPDLARSLLESVIAHRRSGLTRRPVIFLGHSLGGLVIKEALALAIDANSQPCDKEFFKSCYGLVFFGVPNHGLRHEQLLTLVGSEPTEQLIRDLVVDKDSEPTPLLQELGNKFYACCETQGFSIVSFYERKMSHTVQRSKTGKWERSGPVNLMVTKNSATSIKGRRNQSNEIPLDTDHSDLVKIRDADDPNYTEKVRPRLVTLVEDAPAVVKKRFARGTNLLSDQRRLLNNLTRMPLREIRYNKISEPCSGTGEWFLNHQVFKSWRDAPKNSLLWVKGSPGQGKSVLAKIVLKHLESRVPATNCTVLYFFCVQHEEHSNRATDILRALIIQLIDYQELFQHLPTRYIEDHSLFFTAPFSHLKDLCRTLVLNIGDRHIYCVLDALDECSQDGEQRSELLRHFAELVSEQQSNVKFLLTSRPGERDIDLELQRFPSLVLQAHSEDLEAVIKSQVEKLPAHSYDDERKRELRKELHKQAGTTFLWLSIVIKQIASLKFPSMREVKKIFAENPKPLDELYRKLVSRIIAADTPLKISEKLLYWVAYSEQRLTVRELDDAIMCDPEIGTYKSLSERDGDRRLINKQDIREHLGILLEVETKPVGPRGIQDFVYFNHQSVYDYFHGIRDKAFDGKIDLYLAKTCIRYLNAEEFHQLGQQRWLGATSDRYHFLDYASSHWYKHIQTVDDAISEWEQIRNLIDHEKPLLKQWIVKAGRRRYRALDFRGTTVHWLAIRFDISWLTELIISGDCEATAENFDVSQIVAMVRVAPKSFEFLLRVNGDKLLASSEVIEAIAGSRSGIRWMKLLLENETSGIEITESLMVTAASNNYRPFQSEGIVRLLLDHKAATNFEITERLLMSAANNLDESLMQLLLTDGRNGIKITESILISAASNWNVKVMQLILTDHDVKITEDVLVSAAANMYGNVMRLLFTSRRNEINITERILMSAVASSHAMKTILMDDEIKITQDLLLKLLLVAVEIGNEIVVELLLEQQDASFVITESILETAASSVSVMQALLDYGGPDVQITFKVVVASVRHPEVMKLLVERHETGRLRIGDRELFGLRWRLTGRQWYV